MKSYEINPKGNGRDLRMLFTGEYSISGVLSQACIEGKFGLIYNDLLPLLKDHDFAITNFEAPFTKSERRIPKYGKHLKTCPAAMDAVKYAGFHAAVLATNHIMDYSAEGLEETRDLARKAGILTVGAGMNIEEAFRPLFFEAAGKKIALLAMAEAEFSAAGKNKPGAALFDPVLAHHAVEKARKNCDFLFVVIHGGHEFYPLPSPLRRSHYRFLVDAGASAVIACHTHISGGFEIYSGAPIFYNLGNFLFDLSGYPACWNQGYAVRLVLNDQIRRIDLIPYVNCRERPGVWRMEEGEERQFFKAVDQWSEIIGDDDRLEKHWEGFIKSQRTRYLSHLFSLNPLLQQLVGNSFVSKWLLGSKNICRLYNFIRNDAHWSLGTGILEREIEKFSS